MHTTKTRTFLEEIEDVARDRGEVLEWGIIGVFGDEDTIGEGMVQDPVDIPKLYRNSLANWDVLRRFLDYTPPQEFNVCDYHSFYAWSENWVYFVVGDLENYTYNIQSVPRHPNRVSPKAIGV